MGISVREALRLPSLARGRLVAGARGLDRRITSVNMMEVPDIGAYVRAGELLVTTAYPLRDDAAALDELVGMLASRDLAGLALKPRRYIDALPPAMLGAAERLDFPLIELPDDASFNDVLADVLGSILNRHALQLERARAIHDRLNAVALAGGSLHELIDALSSLVGHAGAVFDTHGEVVASVGVQPESRAPCTSRPIQAGSQRHGEMVLWADEAELGADGVIALEHAATIAALEIAQARLLLSREQRHRVLLLEELVSGTARRPAGWRRRSGASIRNCTARSGSGGAAPALMACITATARRRRRPPWATSSGAPISFLPTTSSACTECYSRSSPTACCAATARKRCARFSSTTTSTVDRLCARWRCTSGTSETWPPPRANCSCTTTPCDTACSRSRRSQVASTVTPRAGWGWRSRSTV